MLFTRCFFLHIILFSTLGLHTYVWNGVHPGLVEGDQRYTSEGDIRYQDILQKFMPIRSQILDLCRETRSRGEGNECSGLDSSIFTRFLSLIDVLLNERDVHDALNVSAWKDRCNAQLQLGDVRTPPVCAAAAFTLVPFALAPERQHLRQSVPMGGDIDISHLQLVTVAVDSNYKTHHRSPTAKSACTSDIEINILGKGIKNFYKMGLAGKVELFRSFMKKFVPQNDSNIVVLFVDGSDVIFQGSSKIILERFVRSRARVLFSAEHACFPMKYFPWNINTGKSMQTFCN